MGVYVDEVLKHGGSKSFQWEHSCHMYADSLDELHAVNFSRALRGLAPMENPAQPKLTLF